MKKVLVVDDRTENVYLLQTLLEGHQFAVQTAGNGAVAFELARQDPPQLIISDILMPVMDGFMFCRKCKLDPRLKSIPFVIYSATYTDEKDQEFALAQGADLFIVKPIEPDQFIILIKQLLEQSHAESQSISQLPEEDDPQYYREYSETLIRKLEQKMFQLEETNHSLMISEARYRRHFEHVNDIIYSINLNFEILDVSPSVERILGYTPDEFIGKNVAELGILSSDYLDLALGDIIRVLKGENIMAATYEFIHRDGTRLVGEISGAPLIEDGKVVGVISVGRDITDRKRIEEQLLNTIKEKDVLLQELFHRTKNTLQVIQSMLLLQSINLEGPETHKLVKDTESRIRTIALVHEKLYQSKDLSRINLQEYVAELAALIRQSLSDADTDIEYKLDIEPIFVQIDIAVPLGLVINELVINSWQHGFPNMSVGRITLSLKRVPSGDLELIVTDNGIGFPNDLSVTQPASLGLNMIHSIVRYQLQGSIKFRHQDGVSCKIILSDSDQITRV